MMEQIRRLKGQLERMKAEIKHLATEAEVRQVRNAAIGCLVAALVGGAIVPGIWGRILVVVPLVAVSAALVMALDHTVAFRHKRLQAGQCAHPLCHGVVQHSYHVPEGYVICPTCKRVWPEVADMEFQFTQRGASSRIGRVQLFM